MEEDRYTVRLTAAQHRILRDLVWWAAHDIQQGPDHAALFWSSVVLDEDWDEAVATMQGVNALINPPESLAGGGATPGAPTD